jgi:hypothetical protein
MNELKCQECKKILGFTNKDNAHVNKKYPTIIHCIDCEFKITNKYFEGLKK